MPIFKLKLIKKYEIQKEIMVFIFEKPAGFSFTPGQYGGFTLSNVDTLDPKETTRRFSILNTPEDDFLSIATRVFPQHSPYKTALINLPLHSEVKFAGPAGNFILDNDVSKTTVLIAGGIGITPFYSMIAQESKLHSTRPIFLFYGNRNLEQSAFLEELINLQNNHPCLKVVPVMEQAAKDWQGEVGFINADLIKKYLMNWQDANYYVCGSPGMVNALQEVLLKMGVNQTQIKIEDFPGY